MECRTENPCPQLEPATDAFAEHGDLLLLNYPEGLHDPARTALLPPHAFLGCAVRDELLPDDIAVWVSAPSDMPESANWSWPSNSC